MVLSIWFIKQTAKFSVETGNIPTTQECSHVEIRNEDSAVTCLDIRCIVHFEFVRKGQTDSQVYYVKILKCLREPVHRKRPDLWPDRLIHHHNGPAQKALSVKQFVTQKSITEMEHSPYSPDLAPNDFWLFTEIKSGHWKHPKKYDNCTESYSTTKMLKLKICPCA
jgi:hypothetical protein